MSLVGSILLLGLLSAGGLAWAVWQVNDDQKKPIAQKPEKTSVEKQDVKETLPPPPVVLEPEPPAPLVPTWSVGT